MREKNLADLESEYELELDRIVKEIKKKKAKRVLIQLPDGFKPYATQIADKIKNLTQNNCEVFIWLGSCFGACDTPEKDVSDMNIDLIIQFGHTAWKK